MVTEYKIQEKDLQAILNYLGTRPYVEVAGAIQLLQSLPKVEETQEENTDGN